MVEKGAVGPLSEVWGHDECGEIRIMTEDNLFGDAIFEETREDNPRRTRDGWHHNRAEIAAQAPEFARILLAYLDGQDVRESAMAALEKAGVFRVDGGW